MPPIVQGSNDIHTTDSAIIDFMRRVLFVAVPPIQILDLTGPFEVFARCGGYTVEFAATRRGSVASSCGLSIAGRKHYADVRGPVDTLVIPGGDGAEELLCDGAFLTWLAAMAKRARRTCSICTGAFLLAKAGLLDGRRAVTHWAWCERLARQFPSVQVDPGALFIKDGRLYTSGGVTAGIDLALALVEEDHGPDKARKIAQDLVMFLRRSCSQSQFSSLLSVQASAHRPIEELSGWMIDHLTEDLSVEALAARCHMSPRHFARMFAKEKGMTPARFVEVLRVSAARAFLEKRGMSAKEVASRTGFGGSDSMRRSFLRIVSVTPRRYAETFGS